MASSTIVMMAEHMLGQAVAAVVRLAGLAATSLHLLPIAEAAAVLAVEQCHDALVESLVECDKYGFHCLFLL